MKKLPLLVVLTIAVSACSLIGKKTDSDAGSSVSAGGASATRPVPTAAQTQALAGGQTVKWEQQDITWTLPKGWNKMTVETKDFNYGAPGNAAFFNASISLMDASFPTDISIKAFYDGAVTRQKNGEVDELRWLELDGLKGVQFRESNPEHPDGIRRLQWLAYRKYNGQTQMVNLNLSSSGKDFPAHQDELYAILYSTKLAH
jgi:hypothetical protein